MPYKQNTMLSLLCCAAEVAPYHLHRTNNFLIDPNQGQQEEIEEHSMAERLRDYILL